MIAAAFTVATSGIYWLDRATLDAPRPIMRDQFTFGMELRDKRLKQDKALANGKISQLKRDKVLEGNPF